MIEPARPEPKRGRRIVNALKLLAWSLAIIMPTAQAAEPVRIGVLTSRPKTQMMAQWQPLAVALKQAIPDRDFSVELYNLTELTQAVAARQVDFAITHPSHYVLLSRRSGMSAPLASLVEDIQGTPVTVLGGAIFSRADNTAIRSLPDLKGKIIASPSTRTMYDYQVQAYELSQAGIELPRDARLLFTGDLNDAVVEAVLSGRAEAGFVRAGVLERMADQGRLDMTQVRIINRQPLSDYPAQVSTRLYQGRLFVALPHMDSELSRRIAAALFMLKENHTAVASSMKIHGFTIPADYTMASDMLRKLRLPPFDAAPSFTLYDVWRQYRRWMILSLTGTGFILLLAFKLSISNRRLKSAKAQTKDQLEFIEAIVNAEINGLAVCHGMAEPPYTRFAIWNPSMEALTGYGREEINRLGWYQAVCTDPESQEQMRQHMERIRNGDHLHGEEWTITRKDGGRRIVQVHTAAITQNGQERNTLAIMQDVTERKNADAKLRDSEEKFRQLFEKAPVGIALTRQDLGIFMANPAFCKMFGYTPEELRHQTITSLTQPDYRAQTSQLATSLLKGEIPVYSFEKRYLRKDGSTFWGRIIASEIRCSTPEADCIMGIVEDITERVERETNRLAEIEGQKNILISEIHHRIKNNLQGIVGLLRQYTSQHPAIAEITDTVIGKIHSIALIHGLQAKNVTEEIDLAGLLGNIIDASTGPVIVTNELGCSVLLDKDKAVPVALVLNELLANACKHRSPDSSVAVKLLTDKHNVFITVTNHFDSNRIAMTKDGQGLNLARSLLPKKYAKIFMAQVGDVFFAELKLAIPVVKFDNLQQ